MQDFHLMELPTKILIGEKVLGRIGSFVEEEKKKIIVSGPRVKERVAEIVDSSLNFHEWVIVDTPDMQSVERVVSSARDAECIIGIGGGKTVDVAKLAAFKTKTRFYSIPTSASHDGIASPFASIRGSDRPYSEKAKPPYGILADVDIIYGAPRKLLASGCGDLVSKLTAVKDWELAHREVGEYFGNYAANLARMSAMVVIEHSKTGEITKSTVRDVVEALISSGVAAGIAGSSRPCSGSEHLFSHYLELIAPGVGLHGEKCGIGAIMMAKLHGLDWEEVRESLISFGAPTSAREIGLKDEQVIESLVNAGSLRPERYTILSKLRLSRGDAYELARSTKVI